MVSAAHGAVQFTRTLWKPILSEVLRGMDLFHRFDIALSTQSFSRTRGIATSISAVNYI